MKKNATFGQVWLLIVHCSYNLKDYEYCLSVDLMPNYVLCRYDANETDVFQSWYPVSGFLIQCSVPLVDWNEIHDLTNANLDIWKTKWNFMLWTVKSVKIAGSRLQCGCGSNCRGFWQSRSSGILSSVFIVIKVIYHKVFHTFLDASLDLKISVS